MRVAGVAAGIALLIGGSFAGPVATAGAPLAQQQREAATADAEATGRDVAGLLRRARVALGAGRPAHAVEVLERAEARLLTRGAPAAAAARPVRRGPVAEIAAARAALAEGDADAALARIGAALDLLERRRR